ncbi:TRAFs-binding domain-containing protein [Winogradskyella pacifica]|uniref:TRAFs-binding domain-containing protein n=1 Tax=Winogradskyella pacifica TaxID=664642 RepID=UPI0015C942C4|nr:TRAFs-binding domain-containing protein [Winogradskyella pacifica]
MFYYLIVALQAFCIYHAYKNSKPYYWYFVVLFIPVIGSLIYIITQVYNQNNAEKIQEEITTVLNPTKRIKDLEKKLEFVDTYTNRIELADAYFSNKDIPNAIISYKKTLEDTVQDDLYARQNLMLCYFQLKDYNAVIEQAEFIKDKSEFKGSKQQFCYGLALNELGKPDEAEAQLKQIDRPYSNYAERLELAKFYVENNRTSEGKELLNEISTESLRLTKPNRKLYGATIVEVERMLSAL